MTPEQYIAKIDSMIEEKSLLKHPFYQAWTKGELPMPALQDYAAQYYHHVDAFPTYLSAVHAQTRDIDTRKHILQNLIDEEAGSPNHPELWLMFADELGLAESEVKSTEVWEETANTIDKFRQYCSNHGTAAGLAALYAYESQIPEVSETKIDGLKSFYGIDSAKGLSYFRVHIEADKEHAAVERDLLKQHIDTDNSAAVDEAVDGALDAIWGLLSGVCKRHNIAC